jgi:hypothetical protein
LFGRRRGSKEASRRPKPRPRLGPTAYAFLQDPASYIKLKRLKKQSRLKQHFFFKKKKNWTANPNCMHAFLVNLSSSSSKIKPKVK